MPAWMQYTLLRVGIFAGLLVVLLLTGMDAVLAALLAALLGLALSYVLLRGQREAVAKAVADRLHSKQPKDPDAASEDGDAR